MEKISILNRFDRNNYFSYPYPFFFIDNAYEDKIYSYLEGDYKLFHNYFEKNTQYKENNIRLQISTEEFFDSNLFQNSIWKDFVQFHTSKTFFLQLVDIFSEDMKKIYPKILDIIDKNKSNEDFLNIRNKKNIKEFQFVADCQPGINTPNLYKSSVRQSHLDNSAELFAGLFYLRDDLDDSSGGNMQVMEIKKNKKTVFHQKSLVKNQSDLNIFKEIKYEKNKVIFFMNTINSIHSVSPRSATSVPRNLTNIIFETYDIKNRLFSEYKKRQNLLSKIKNLIGI
jgi:hypothetical protein